MKRVKPSKPWHHHQPAQRSKILQKNELFKETTRIVLVNEAV